MYGCFHIFSNIKSDVIAVLCFSVYFLILKIFRTFFTEFSDVVTLTP